MYVWNYQLNFITLQAENTQGPGSCPPQWGTTFAAFVRLGVSSLVSVVSGKTWTERLMLGLKPSTLNWESRGSPNLPSTIMIIIYIYILYIYYNMEHKLHNPKKRRQSVRPRKVFCSSAGRTSTILQPWKQHNSQWTWRLTWAIEWGLNSEPTLKCWYTMWPIGGATEGFSAAT